MSKQTELLFLNKNDVRALLGYPDAIELMRSAFMAVSRGDAVQPIRRVMPLPTGSGMMMMLPGALTAPDSFGIKTVTIFPQNFGTETPSHQGLVTLYNPETGTPYALLDGGEVTAIRTAAATAVATEALARKDAKTITIFGYGEQAATHIAALSALARFDQFRIWGRDFEKATAFAARQSDHRGVQVEAIRDARTSIKGADIICTTTSAAEPVLLGDWLEPGQHINLVGSPVPNMREVDSTLVARTKFYCDYEASLRELGGEFRHALADGKISDDHLVGEVGHVLLGTRPGRETENEITVFKSLGMIAEDLVACDHIYHRAVAQGRGQKIRM